MELILYISFAAIILVSETSGQCDDGSIRLLGGETVNEGRVEVCIGGVWGTVCDDNWDRDDAAVTCRRAGFCAEGAVAFPSARFGAGSGSILLDEVICSGDEESLLDCTYVSGSITDCTHDEDASVRCDVCCEGDIRLEDGSESSSGRVHVCGGNPLDWGTVCNDHFDVVDASVVCRQLGHSRHNASFSTWGGGSGEILMDDVDCRGDELRLIDCSHRAENINCIHFEDIGVVCSETLLCSEGEVKLVGGSDDGDISGRVEMCVNEEWRSICSLGWSAQNTEVLCRELGYATRGSGIGMITTIPGNGSIYHQQYTCTGDETRLIDCTTTNIISNNCTHAMDITLQCSNRRLCSDGTIRLVGSGRDNTRGRLEVCLNEIWGTVCDDGFDTADATVVCRQLGFSEFNARVLPQNYQNGGSGEIHFNNVQCTGTEESLLSCTYNTNHDCLHLEDVQVACQPLLCEDGDIQLVDGPSLYEGRLEICYNETWGTVCDDLWIRNDRILSGGVAGTSVVCRQLGFSSDHEILLSSGLYPAPSDSPILLDEVRCSGDEDYLLDCDSRDIGNENCGHDEDINLRCGQCNEYDVRIIDGSDDISEGIVEVCLNGRWGTVCDDNDWDASDAKVICRQLSLPHTGAQSLNGGVYSSNNISLPIVMSEVSCAGLESSLEGCRYNNTPMMSSCNVAGVYCSLAFPNAPRNFSVIVVTTTTLQFSWTAPISSPDYLPVTGYVVICDSSVESYHVTVLESPASIMAVSPYTDYYCCVSANSSRGESPNVTCLSVETPDDVPSDSPTILRAISLSSYSIYISWSSPTIPNGLITQYHINIIEQNTHTSWQNITINQYIEIVRLHPYYNYSITVAAVTIDEGPYSHSVDVVTYQDTPDAVPINLIVTNTMCTTLTVTWEPPDEMEWNGILIHHVLTMRVTLTAAQSTIVVPMPNLIYIINDLIPYTQYQLAIASATVNGTGPSTNINDLRISTDQCPPYEPPQNIQHTILDSRTVRLDWEPPLSPNGVISTYTILWNDIQTNELLKINRLSFSYTLTDLHPYYIYQYNISAHTVDYGPYSNITTIQMPEDIPSGSPQNVIVTGTTQTTISLSWTPPHIDEQNGVIIMYRATITGSERILETSLTFITISSLIANTEYMVTMAAKTIVGYGPESYVIRARTASTDISSPPQNVSVKVIDHHQLRVTWTPPPPSELSGVFEGYHITLTEVTTGSMWTISIIDDVTHYTITDLHPNYMYQVELAINTNQGLGLFSRTLSATTSPYYPSDSPKILSTEVTTDEVILSWSTLPLDKQNGDITNYVINIHSGGQDTLLTISVSVNTATIMAQPFTEYVLSVAAVNSVGRGPFSNVTIVRTDEDVPSHEPVNLRGNAISSTSITIYWDQPPVEYHNGFIDNYTILCNEIATDRLVQTFTSTTSVTINRLHPYYTYECNVSAVTVGAGPYSEIISITTLEDASGPPQNLTVLECGGRHIVVAWQPPIPSQRNGMIRSYLINVTLNNALSSSVIHTVPSSLMSYNITLLQPNTLYDIHVAAVTLTPGVTTNIISIKTKQMRPSSSPRSLRLDAESADTLNISWHALPADEHNGILTHYIIMIYELESGSSREMNASSTQLVISDLHPYYNYDITVAAATEAGHGPFSQPQTIQMPEAAPSAPPSELRVNEIDVHYVDLTWSPPPSQHHNGIITEYIIYYIETNGTSIESVLTTQTSAYISNLQPNTLYFCSVAAVTLAIGPNSTLLNFTTEIEPTGAVVNLRANAVSPQSIHLSWEPPLIGNTVTYIINVTLGDDIRHNTLYISAPITSVPVESLQPDTLYMFTVTPRTDSGTGPSHSVLARTLPNVAMAPTLGEVVRISATEIRLTWEPSINYTLITEYSIKYYPLSTELSSPDGQRSNDDLVYFITTKKTEAILTNLDPVYSYSVAVAAVNDAGTGNYTKEYTVGLFDTCHFQLFLVGGNLICQEWVMFHKLEYLSIQLTNVLDKNCDCGLSPKYFVFDEPHCLASQPEWIILSGFIIGTDISNCSVIMNHLQVWAEAGSKLIVEGITLAAIKHCSVYREEGDPFVCTKEDSVSEQSIQLIPVIGGIVGIILLVVIVAGVCVVVVRRHQKKTIDRLSRANRTDAYNITSVVMKDEPIYDLPDMVRVYDHIPEPLPPSPPPFPPNDLPPVTTTTFCKSNTYEVKPRVGLTRPEDPSLRASDYADEYETAVNVKDGTGAGDYATTTDGTGAGDYATLHVTDIDFNKDMPSGYSVIKSNDHTSHYQPLSLATYEGQDSAYAMLHTTHKSQPLSSTSEAAQIEKHDTGDGNGESNEETRIIVDVNGHAYNKLQHYGLGATTTTDVARQMTDNNLSSTSHYQSLIIPDRDENQTYTMLHIASDTDQKKKEVDMSASQQEDDDGGHTYDKDSGRDANLK